MESPEKRCSPPDPGRRLDQEAARPYFRFVSIRAPRKGEDRQEDFLSMEPQKEAEVKIKPASGPIQDRKPVLLERKFLP